MLSQSFSVAVSYNSPSFIFKNTRSSRLLVKRFLHSAMSDNHRDREDPLDISLIEMLGHTAGPLPVEPQVTTMPDISARKTEHLHLAVRKAARWHTPGSGLEQKHKCCLCLCCRLHAADWESFSDRNLNRLNAGCAEVPKLELAADVDEDAAGIFMNTCY